MKKIRQQHLRKVRAGERGCPPGLGTGARCAHRPPVPSPGRLCVQLADFSLAGIEKGDSVCGVGSWGEGWGVFCNDRSCLAAISR